ncbi:MAG TPA: NAD(P)-binding domain-containing protein [Anaeromyxobacteraceae bacterium]|nr:NAD(P)-binding domain-containing protein [Anaeromyxobacteraceae bacterium]
MRVGIIGAGQIGALVAELLTKAGHVVALSHRGSLGSLGTRVAALGSRARAATVEETCDFAEVVMLAIPWRNREDLPARRLRRKIAIDAMNPYRPDFGLYDLGDSTSSEEVAKALPGTRLVKAFNSLRASDLASLGRKDRPVAERIALPIAGDDAAAKRRVAKLVVEVGFAPVDTGSLRQGGRLQEPGGPFFGRAVSGADASAAMRRAAEARHEAALGVGQRPGDSWS